MFAVFSSTASHVAGTDGTGSRVTGPARRGAGQPFPTLSATRLRLAAAVLLLTFEPLAAGPPSDDVPGTAWGELCGPGHDAFLRGRLHGAIEGTLDWAGAGLSCDGMLRPSGGGVRLLFRGPLDDSRLSLIIGIDGQYEGLAGQEWPANLTLIAEGEGRFFATAGDDRCRVGIRQVEALDGGRYGISGKIWCVGGVPSLSDLHSVRPEDLDFRGRFLVDAD